jgi:hypothetical protein
MRRIIYISFVCLLWINLSLSQEQDSFKIEFLQKAPPLVKEYYRVFDSLAHPTWNKSLPEDWSDAELKKYASMIYDANEYDPIAKRKIDDKRYKDAMDAKTNYFVHDVDVFQETKKRLSKIYEWMINRPYFLTIVVEDIKTIEVPRWGRPNEIITRIVINGKVEEVWKGNTYKVGDNITFSYHSSWNYQGFVKGNSYIVVLYPIFDNRIDNFILRVGGFNKVQQEVFPIDNNTVVDEDNFWGLGNKVDRTTFIDSLTSTINEIKSWRNLIR